ncbi:Bax inhibitor 1-related protein [Dioscorea alata]|uniref:Bax inhibitor 1-related protein n=1 Tax=Dioscorea alata TaxID=55571 RepID=A0ACB7TYE1_DIOAL|nr:Bax inhibitor 1-related protein [Dioscorea alata]
MVKEESKDAEKGNAVEKEAKDLEKGNANADAAVPPPLYPKMAEDPRARWAFIRKVYTILAAQFLFTSAVGAVGDFVHPIPKFFRSGGITSIVVFVAILLSPFIAMFPMLIFRRKHPINLVLLSIFTACISCSVCVFSSLFGVKAFLEAAILTCTVFVALTLYTFWAARGGYDFTFLFPFLFATIHVLLVYLIIQLFFPLDRIVYTVYSLLATLLFSGFIIFHTESLIKRHSYDEYIIAAIELYLAGVNLFTSLLGLAGIA